MCDHKVTCSICLKTVKIDDKYITACNHVFHSSCWHKWVEILIEKSSLIHCPLCRNNCGKFETFPMFSFSECECKINCQCECLCSYEDECECKCDCFEVCFCDVYRVKNVNSQTLISIRCPSSTSDLYSINEFPPGTNEEFVPISPISIDGFDCLVKELPFRRTFAVYKLNFENNKYSPVQIGSSLLCHFDSGIASCSFINLK